MASEKKTSPWVYVGLGCAGTVVLIIVVGVGAIFMLQRWTKSVERTMNDPVARTERAMELLGCQELPESYNAMLGLDIPFVAEIAILTDREPDSHGKIEEFGERAFIYLKMSRLLGKKAKQDFMDFIEGKKKNPDIFVQSNIRIDGHELLKRGEMDLDGPTVTYAVHRGDVQVEGHETGGLATIMLIECPEDSQPRFGVWLGRDPSEDEPLEGVDLTGTTADESAMREFLGHFSFCGA